MGRDPYESEPPPEQIPAHELGPDAIEERERILAKTGILLTQAARFLAEQGRPPKPGGARIEVQRGHVILAAEILFVPETERRLPWLSNYIGCLPFHSCFISHSVKDRGFCDRLYADLRSEGVKCWYFPEQATWGELVWGEIDRGIRFHDKLVVV